MTFTITTNQSVTTLNLPPEESAVMQEVGKLLVGLPIPNNIEIEAADGSYASFTVKARGSYVKDGERRPSMYVTCTHWGLCMSPSLYRDAYLTCVNSESNNYKYYWLRPQNVGGRTVTLQATYGRIGSARGEAFGTKDLQTPYEPYLYWIRYYEKLSKGYVDQSDIYLSDSKPDDKQAPADAPKEEKAAEKTPSQILYETLLRDAKGVVETHLASRTVTTAQVKKGWEIWNTLGECETVDAFNEKLKALFSVSPRKVREISSLLAVSEKDFKDIVEREENLLNAMAAVAGSVKQQHAASGPSFKDFGIHVYAATEKQREKVMAKLPPDLQRKVKTIYRVIPEEQKARFNAYLKDNGIKAVKEFWHGSRNENWLNITKVGLKLNPNAVITAKMLGYGAYFAPDPHKSLNYTSLLGSYWAKGTSKHGFMGLFATAYGNPWMITQVRHYTQSELKAAHKNCVHARSGLNIGHTTLRNDEVVFYDEAAMLLNYIVEFVA